MLQLYCLITCTFPCLQLQSVINELSHKLIHIINFSVLNFLRHHWKLRTETCNASLKQHCLEVKLVDFGLVALLSSYGVICSPRQLLPAIQSLVKNKFSTTGCLSTRQFNLYKSDGNSSEIQRTRLSIKATQPKFRLPQHTTACNWRRSLIWHPPLQIT